MTREEVIAFLKQVENILLHNNSWLESTHNPIKESFEMAIEALKEARPRGKWIYEGAMAEGHPHCAFYCSVCDGHICRVPSDLPNFCEFCGADMREGEAE